MKTFNPKNGAVQQQTACVLKETQSAECGVYGYVRMGTDVYGESAPQQKNCAGTTQNTPLFFESERGFGGKRKPSFPVKRKFSLSPKLSPFTLIELLVLAAQHCCHFISNAGTVASHCIH